MDEAEFALVSLEMENEQKIKAIEKLALEFSKLQNDIAISKQELAIIKQEITVTKQELETLKSIKQLMLLSFESQAQ